MPGSNRRPTACKADVITTTLELRRKKASPIQQFLQGCSHRAHSSVRAGRFFAYESPNLGFWGALAGPSRLRFCLHAVADTVPALFATAALSTAGCERALRPESQHALPCMQLQSSPRGVDTSSKEPRGIAIVNPHHSSADAHAAKADARTAARASTGAQHRRTTNKKRSPETRPRALRRSIILPTGERRRGTLPLHQRRRGRIKRLRVLQLDRMVVFTSDDTDVPRRRTLHFLM